MARQQTYAPDAVVHDGDKWLITDITDNGTKNISVAALAEYFASTGIADPNRVGFHYEYTQNAVLAPGQFRYVNGTVSNFGTISQIEIHRYTNRGVDFNPALQLIDQTNIKITDVTEATSTGYGYFRADSFSQTGDTILFNLEFLSASGQVPQGNTVFTVLGHFEGVSGGEIKEGPVDPITAEIVGFTGDVFFHVDEVAGEIDVYGPLSTNVPLNDSYAGWGTPIQLNGDEGQAVNAVSSQVRTDGSGTDMTFYVGTPDPNNPDPAFAIATSVFVPQGPQGLPGAGYTNLAVDSSGNISATAENGATPFVTTNIEGPRGPLNGVASFQPVTDPPGQPAGTYLEVTFDSGDIIYIPDAEDGSHGRGINAIQVVPRGTSPTETYNVQVQFLNADGSTSAFMNVGVISDGVDGTPGTNGEGVEVEVTTSTATDYVLTFTPINADGSEGTPIVTPNLQGADGTTLLVEGGTSTPTPTNATQVTFAGTAISDVEVVGGVATVTINDDDTDQIPDATATGQILTSTGTGEGDWEWDAVPADTITVQDETVVVGGADTITTLNFTGGVVVTPGATGVVNIDISGGTPPAMTPAINHSGAQQREVGETFTILLTAVHVDTFTITPPVNADLTNGWTQTNSTDSNGNVTVIITPDSTTAVDTSVLTVNGTYTLAGNPDVFNFPTITIPLATFFGWHYGQTANDVDLPDTTSSITVDEYFSNGGPGTLQMNFPDDDQGHFNSPEDIEGNLSDGAFLYFAFPGMTEYKFYNEGRRLRNVETMVSTAIDTFRYYKIQVGDDFEIQITT